ncbi:thymidine phosphorylase [Opitutus terrae]|uniref:thymidine phosphorylase n=1 Tax=Opitutus terrae (strain DSM 11246 / JCM 15787 / PB90-1) TaxID=452637 RepID=B1ZTW7_OPITP|nr:thymidine phosphorylase [Opitutus terrae]ACB75849.1 pyrimidine-nucleoside phosphorylase [Opitutus terrae PB90-1]
MTKRTIPARRFIKPTFEYLIEKKRDGGEFTQEEIRYIIDSTLDGEMPQHQLAALMMAIYFSNMSAQETADLTEEMMLSGEVIDLSHIAKPKIDKYSTGGVGDKTSLVLVPLAMASGVIVPMMCGVEHDYVINTLEKLGAFPGFKGQMPIEQFTNQLARIGGAIVQQSDALAPADAKFYALRKETGTIPSLPLITGSVLSKKLAEGSEGLVIDVKWGNGSFIKDLEQAKQLARSMTRVGRSMKRRCVALVTDMNQPLGDTVGTSLEVKEAIQLLKGEGPEDMKELVLKLGMEIVRLAGVAGSTLSAKQTVQRHLTDGSALQKFKDLVKAQGGDTMFIDHPEKFPAARHIRKLPAPKRGYVHTINAAMIARGVHLLGAGVEAAAPTGNHNHGAHSHGHAKVDHAVGVSEIKKVGTQVKQGEPLMMIHYNDEAKLEQALEYFKNAYRLAPKRPTPPPLIVERVA